NRSSATSAQRWRSGCCGRCGTCSTSVIPTSCRTRTTTVSEEASLSVSGSTASEAAGHHHAGGSGAGGGNSRSRSGRSLPSRKGKKMKFKSKLIRNRQARPQLPDGTSTEPRRITQREVRSPKMEYRLDCGRTVHVEEVRITP